MKTALLIFLLICYDTLLAQDPPEKYQKVWLEVNEGNPEKARKELSKLMKKDPNDPWPYWMRGILGETSLGSDQNESRSFYEKALSADSTFGPAYYNIAALMDDSAEIDQKIEYYRKAIIYYPQNGFSYIYRGKLYLKQGHFDLAMKDAENAKNCELTDPSLIDALIIEVLYAQGKTKELQSFINKGQYADLQLMWDYDTYYILIGVYEDLKQPENVCKICKTIQEEYSMFEQDPPAIILEKLKNCK